MMLAFSGLIKTPKQEINQGNPSIETAITVALIGAIVALFGFIANHRLSVWRDKRSERIQACQKFRECFLRELKGLYPLSTDWPDNWSGDIHQRLESVFSNLQIAIAEFRPFIPWYSRWAFDRAWSRYRNAYEKEKIKIGDQCYHHYMSFSSNPDPKGNFRRNVDKLLSFAKYH